MTSKPMPEAADAPHCPAGADPQGRPERVPGLGIGNGSSGDVSSDGAAPPVFAAPWQAQAFALALALHARGVFSWPEWTAALGRRIDSAQAGADSDSSETYWQHWLTALEDLVDAKGAGSRAELRRTAQAWAHAAERTPHGQPMDLRPEDYPAAA